MKSIRPAASRCRSLVIIDGGAKATRRLKLVRTACPAARAFLTETSDSIRVALWGDSQAEGVCVADKKKLFAQIENAAQQDIAVLPFARSGQDASDWLPQMKKVEKNLNVDAHLILIVDLPDLNPETSAGDHGPVETTTNSKIAASVPAFVIQAGRHLITDNDGNRRRLRFSVGPQPKVLSAPCLRFLSPSKAPTAKSA